MEKNLKDMSLEELWQLFPIELVPHQMQWSDWAATEMEYLRGLMSCYTPIISHVGSTAVKGIMAKPIIDVLIQVPGVEYFQEIRILLEEAGYICMFSLENRMSFNRGYTPRGYAKKVFHLHLRVTGDNDEILFRDYLQKHPSVAREYELLKLSLLPEYRNDRDGYTEAKSEFVRRVTEMAVKESER